jgi:hypothetical protein
MAQATASKAMALAPSLKHAPSGFTRMRRSRVPSVNRPEPIAEVSPEARIRHEPLSSTSSTRVCARRTAVSRVPARTLRISCSEVGSLRKAGATSAAARPSSTRVTTISSSVKPRVRNRPCRFVMSRGIGPLPSQSMYGVSVSSVNSVRSGVFVLSRATHTEPTEKSGADGDLRSEPAGSGHGSPLRGRLSFMRTMAGRSSSLRVIPQK